jgi:hypothetical protein
MSDSVVADCEGKTSLATRLLSWSCQNFESGQHLST